MQRITIDPRPNLAEALESRGMIYHKDYYTETYAYEFSAGEIDKLEKATAELFDMCLAAVEHVIKQGLWERFFIPREQAEFITRSWEEDDISIYGRFDIGYDSRTGSIKMLEFNADTPTALLEAAVIQWDWRERCRPATDQWNSIHERLVEHFRSCKPFMKHTLYLACARDSAEDYMTTAYIAECARQAGQNVQLIFVDEISINTQDDFCLPDGTPIGTIFKLYPWEWMFNEEFGQYLGRNYIRTTWIEPPYKAILSNKMLLPLLWELYPDHPLLLESHYHRPDEEFFREGKWVLKPVYSREGANVRILSNGDTIEETEGEYGEEGYIAQQFMEIGRFDGWLPVLGAWVIAGEPAGMGIREQKDSLITGNMAQFVPHVFT